MLGQMSSETPIIAAATFRQEETACDYQLIYTTTHKVNMNMNMNTKIFDISKITLDDYDTLDPICENSNEEDGDMRIIAYFRVPTEWRNELCHSNIDLSDAICAEICIKFPHKHLDAEHVELEIAKTVSKGEEGYLDTEWCCLELPNEDIAALIQLVLNRK